MTLLSAQTSVVLPDPVAIVDAFHEHFNEHMTMTREGQAVHFEADYGNGTLSAEEGRFAARINCVSENVLLSVKAMVAEHIVEFTGDTSLDFRWEGHGSDLRELPNLFVGRVVRSYNLTPRMRRVVFAVDNGIERLAAGGLHVRLLILPDQTRTPVWPHLSKTGAIVSSIPFAPSTRNVPRSISTSSCMRATTCPARISARPLRSAISSASSGPAVRGQRRITMFLQAMKRLCL